MTSAATTAICCSVKANVLDSVSSLQMRGITRLSTTFGRTVMICTKPAMAVSRSSSSLECSFSTSCSTTSSTHLPPTTLKSWSKAYAAVSRTASSSSQIPFRMAGTSVSRCACSCSLVAAWSSSVKPRHTPWRTSTLSDPRPVCSSGIRVGSTASPSLPTRSPRARPATCRRSHSPEASEAWSMRVRRGSMRRSMDGVLSTSAFHTVLASVRTMTWTSLLIMYTAARIFSI
mmetsp:Transcript_90332/g.156448  ORF Transcript_90332/g.156448 Transcript_90332/m.156448 type:complete len:231 (-) Transcript_90332:3218-3910(-)